MIGVEGLGQLTIAPIWHAAGKHIFISTGSCKAGLLSLRDQKTKPPPISAASVTSDQVLVFD